ncbi:MAG: hypothetical protein AB8G17_16185 [Gammaproteobacteria bacterium]
MNTETILEHYAALRARDARMGMLLRPMTMVKYSAPEVQEIEDLKVAREALEQFDSTQGWATQQSANKLWVDGFTALTPSYGQLLSFEAVNASGDALHLRRRSGGWLLVRYLANEGEPTLSDEIEFLANDGRVERLRYRRFWRIAEADHDTRPFAVCFAGMTLSDQQEKG